MASIRVQRLRVLRSQVDAMPPDEVFNSEVAEVFARLRDWHTCYRRPGFEGKVAALPFIIESYNEGANPRYVVTKVANGCRRAAASRRAWKSRRGTACLSTSRCSGTVSWKQAVARIHCAHRR